MTLAVKPPCDEAVIRSAPAAAPCAPSTGRWVLLATVIGSSMVFMDGSIANLALPVLQRELDASMSQAQWVVEIYLLFLSALILVGGAAGDRFGRRRVFALGVVLFAAASLWCGFATDIPQLVFARGLQGVGGALLAPGSLALISASFRDEARGRAIGTWSGFSAIAASLGPVVGGWLIEHGSWRWAFWINVPLAAFVLAVLYLRVPESRNRQAARLDLIGACIATTGLGLLVFGLVEAGARGLGHPLVMGAILGGALGLAGFVLYERRAPVPMMPLTLFRSRAFTGANLLTLLLYAALGGAMFFLPFNLMQVQGYSATAAGAATLPFILLVFFLSRWSGGLVAHYGSRGPLIIGPAITAVGFALLAWPGIGGSYWTTFFPGIVVLGFGMSVSIAPLTTTVMNAVEDEHVGIASGINNAVARTASLLAIALFNLFVSRDFNADLDRHLAALQAPAEYRLTLDSERAKLAGAEVRRSVGEPLRSAIDRAIDESFVHSFRHVMFLAVLLALASAACAAVTLRPIERRELLERVAEGHDFSRAAARRH
jgi:EmrB/QacA subfamily drug resistance transporter